MLAKGPSVTRKKNYCKNDEKVEIFTVSFSSSCYLWRLLPQGRGSDGAKLRGGGSNRTGHFPPAAVPAASLSSMTPATAFRTLLSTSSSGSPPHDQYRPPIQHLDAPVRSQPGEDVDVALEVGAPPHVPRCRVVFVKCLITVAGGG